MISEDGSSPLCMKAEENSEITSCIKHTHCVKVEEEPIIIQTIFTTDSIQDFHLVCKIAK